MAVITIGGNSYFSYQTVAEVDVYASAAVGPAADAWRAQADEDAKGRDAVSATRLIDRQSWAGEKTDPAQDGAFPRTGLTYPDGTEVDSTTVPPEVLSAHSEISMALEADPAMLTSPTTASNIRRQKAGSVEIEYFNVPGSGTRFPLTVMELLGFWLGGALGVDGSESTGTCGESAFESDYGFTRGF